MKKLYSSWELSEQKCKKCKKKLKKRLVEQNPKWELCYKCYKDEKLTNQAEKDRWMQTENWKSMVKK